MACPCLAGSKKFRRRRKSRSLGSCSPQLLGAYAPYALGSQPLGGFLTSPIALGVGVLAVAGGAAWWYFGRARFNVGDAVIWTWTSGGRSGIENGVVRGRQKTDRGWSYTVEMNGRTNVYNEWDRSVQNNLRRA